jgi:hypothetical protein
VLKVAYLVVEMVRCLADMKAVKRVALTVHMKVDSMVG